MRKSLVFTALVALMAIGITATASHNTFTDVPDDHLFFNGVEWAAANGITVGCGGGSEFCPDALVTRGQMVTFLKRYHDRFVGDVGAVGEENTFVVGTDIQPGTYRADDASDSCYWERLSGFSGEFEDIIANGFQTIVTIASTDVGFYSSDCGTWTRI